MHSTPEKEKPPGLLLIHISKSSLFFSFATKALLPTAAGQNHKQATSRTVAITVRLRYSLWSWLRYVDDCALDLPYFIAPSIARNSAPSSMSGALGLPYIWSSPTDISAKQGLRITLRHLGRYAMENGCYVATELHSITTRQTVILIHTAMRTSHLKCLQ